MNNTLNDFNLTDRQTFIRVPRLITQDYLEYLKVGKTEHYPLLRSIKCALGDIQGYYDNTNQNIIGDKPDCSTLADIVKGARIYE
jgi:hypothetical protein